MKALLYIILSMTAFAVVLTGCERQNTEKSVVTFFAMDTRMTLTAYGDGMDEILEEARDRVLAWEALWSVTEEKSEIYAVNAGAMETAGETDRNFDREVSVSAETADIIRFALEMARETDGALDPTVYPLLRAWGFTTGEYRIPDLEEIAGLLERVGYARVRLEENVVRLEPGMMLDLGAVGKGWAGDLLIDFLRERNVTSAILDLGGNIQTLGSKPDGTPWRLGLRDPFSQDLYGVVEVRDAAVVTSGAYERYFTGEDGRQYGHILDPATGCPAQSGLASVTVISSEGKLCDALSTALYVMGLEKASAYWRAHQDFEMVLVTREGEIYLTPGAEDLFTPHAAGAEMARQIITP